MDLQHAMGERTHIDALLDTGDQHAVVQGHIIFVVGWSAAHDQGTACLDPDTVLYLPLPTDDLAGMPVRPVQFDLCSGGGNCLKQREANLGQPYGVVSQPSVALPTVGLSSVSKPGALGDRLSTPPNFKLMHYPIYCQIR